MSDVILHPVHLPFGIEGAFYESGSPFIQEPEVQSTGPLLNNREFSIHGRGHTSF